MLFQRGMDTKTLSMASAAQELEKDPSIYLLDVRSQEEYRQMHIPGSHNLPLDRISQVAAMVPDKSAKVFVYCLSGGRSQMACTQMTKMGYTNVTNIGGISNWRGELKRGAEA